MATLARGEALASVQTVAVEGARVAVAMGRAVQATVTVAADRARVGPAAAGVPALGPSVEVEATAVEAAEVEMVEVSTVAATTARVSRVATVERARVAVAMGRAVQATVTVRVRWWTGTMSGKCTGTFGHTLFPQPPCLVAKTPACEARKSNQQEPMVPRYFLLTYLWRATALQQYTPQHP